jgi:hypothetical protein
MNDHFIGDAPEDSAGHPPVRHVPPNSTALRELLGAIAGALTLSAPATQKDEVTYLRISRDRARTVLLMCRRLLADREADDGDVMAAVAGLRDQAAQLRDDAYDHGSLTP